MAFIAGRYASQFGGSSLGQTAEGIKLAHKFFTREVKGDAGAETVQDEIYRGGEVMLDTRLIEFNAAGAQSAFWPWAASFLDLGVIGRLAVGGGIAKQIILTAVAGTNATPLAITLPYCLLAAGFPVELLFAPDLREVPLKMRVFPGGSYSGGTLGNFGSIA